MSSSPVDIASTPLVVSMSGGKDSAGTGLHLQALGLQYESIYFDTGWESQKTYTYLRDVLPDHVGPIRWLRPEVDLEGELLAIAERLEGKLGHYSAMVRLILKRGMFPSRTRRYCTQELKVFVARDYFRARDDDAVSVVGVRAQESAARFKLSEWEWSDTFDTWTWRPLIDWSESDVIAAHTRAGLPPNPLYLQGASRVGCWPCIYARKSEVRMLAEMDPARLAVIRELESEVGRLATIRAEGRGEELANTPTWFHNPNPPRDRVTRKVLVGTPGYDSMWPIDRVVEWSKTSRGGRQFELFEAPERERGCMRWGLCDTPPRRKP